MVVVEKKKKSIYCASLEDKIPSDTGHNVHKLIELNQTIYCRKTPVQILIQQQQEDNQACKGHI